MNSRERILAAARFQETDCLPVAPYMGNHGARVAGTPLGEYCTNARALAQAQLKAWEVYGQDAVVAQSDNYYMAEAFGVVTHCYEDSIPTVERTAIETLADAARLRKPNPATDGRMPVYLEAIRILKDLTGNEVAIRGCGTGPFVLAGHLLGPEKLVLEVANIEYGEGGDTSALRALLELCTETLIDFAVLQLEAGATIVQCADSLASIDMISPSIYEKLVFPHEVRFYQGIAPHCRRHDAVSLLHICGNNAKVFHLYREVGADIVAVDHKADLAEAKRVMGDRVCLIGNLDPSSLLLAGSVADVERESRRCIEKAANGGGYILGTGCEVAERTPKENLKAMVRIAREHRSHGVGR
jgi:uroporphyrinogen decarboxylase